MKIKGAVDLETPDEIVARLVAYAVLFLLYLYKSTNTDT